MNTMKSRLEMIARQQGCSLLFLHSTINTWLIYMKLQQLIFFSIFTSILHQNGVSHHWGHVLPDRWPVLPGGGAAAMWQCRGCEGCPTRRVTPCKRNTCRWRQSPTSCVWSLNYWLSCSPASLSFSCSGQGSRFRMLSWPHTVSHFTIESRVAVLKPCSFFTQSETFWGVLQKVGSAIYPVQHPRGQVPTLLFYY